MMAQAEWMGPGPRGKGADLVRTDVDDHVQGALTYAVNAGHGGRGNWFTQTRAVRSSCSVVPS